MELLSVFSDIAKECARIPTAVAFTDINYFPIKAYQILEDVFEWNVSFKPNEESTWIQWKIAKSDWNVNEKRMPEFLSVNADELLFF